MRLQEIEWDNGKGAEDLVIWGIKPIQWLLELFDETYIQRDFPEPEDESACWFYYEIKGKLEELERYLMEINDVACGRIKKDSNDLTQEEWAHINKFINIAKDGGPVYEAISTLIENASKEKKVYRNIGLS